MSIVFKGKLRLSLPESGMKYESSHRLLHNDRRESRVADALRAAGYEITPASITEVLIHLFKTATPLVVKGRADGEDLWDILPLVQKEIDWASKVPEATFLEMFVCLIEARCQWEKNPVYPFDRYELYNAAVLALIAFRTAVGDCNIVGESWIVTDAVFFNELAEGFDIDDDEDEDVDMNDSDDEEVDIREDDCETIHSESHECHLRDEDPYNGGSHSEDSRSGGFCSEASYNDSSHDEDEDEEIQDENLDPTVAAVIPPMVKMAID
ncbi:hypothetical protein NPX13_g6498 [Xylaria arbuscula]|uniref:Uncharacterized protein n=1 Tax=Xylaria arbuscula TaxID=114810 RepID=A0A9W8NCF1_9PEZI|nr:hypothetical protein NPX13_g6498 [Xylaria arbuscula]